MKYILLISILAGTSYAGVRTVGKGGGYAEMQAILINDQLQMLSEGCLNKFKSCKLSSSEMDLLSSSLASSFVLDVTPLCTEPVITIHNQNAASIMSCALYQEDQAVAKNFSEIATWVLTARLMANQGLPMSSAESIALKVFNHYEQKEQKLSISLSESAILFHFLQIKRETDIYNIVALEGNSSTVDITSRIQSLLQCNQGSLNFWNLSPLGYQEIETTKAVIESEVEWQCTDSNSYRANLQIFFAAPQSEISEGSIRIKVVRKTVL